MGDFSIRFVIFTSTIVYSVVCNQSQGNLVSPTVFNILLDAFLSAVLIEVCGL